MIIAAISISYILDYGFLEDGNQPSFVDRRANRGSKSPATEWPKTGWD